MPPCDARARAPLPTLFVVLVVLVLGALPSPAAAQPRPAPRPREVICRDGWGARPAGAGLVPHTIKYLTVHHSGVALKDNRRAPDRIRSAQRFHQAGKRSWPDIAYHYLIDLEGNVYEGRSDRFRGDTGTRYDTTGHFLICVVGNYEEQPARPAQVEAVVDLLAWAAARHGVSPKSIRGHRRLARTDCPGKHLQALIDDGSLRRRVEQRLAAGGVSLRRVCGAEAGERVKAIRRPAEPVRTR